MAYSFFTALAAFAVSALLEAALKPRPRLSRPFFAWLCQFGLFLSLYAVFLLLLGRPLCSAGLILAVYLILILVNNAKYESLREPFLYQDYDYFLDVIRYPRLFLPFLGVKNFALCVLGGLAAVGGILLENPPENRFSLDGQAGAALLMLGLGLSALLIGSSLRSKPEYNAESDYKKLGFSAFLYCYGLESGKKISLQSPFAKLPPLKKSLPSLIAIQSESFFDPRPWDPALSPEILQGLDRFQERSFMRGFLKTPAWGANTVRTEFSFLTGLDSKNLGPHQFNPYRAMLKGWLPKSLPAMLKEAGYETICLHPWPAAFYGRKSLFPQIGFNQFKDLKNFSDCRKSGAYTDDRCLGEKLLAALKEAKKPVFIFAISMENHGPLADDADAGKRMAESSFRKDWPPDCPELPIYIDHLVHADMMLSKLFKELTELDCPLSLCFYGDHVPIMPRAYKKFGFPQGDTPYFCWDRRHEKKSEPGSISASDLALAWLKGCGVI